MSHETRNESRFFYSLIHQKKYFLFFLHIKIITIYIAKTYYENLL